MNLKKKSRILALALTLVFMLTNVALAATVYVGKVGFDADRITNEAAYEQAFGDYLADNLDKPVIVDNGFGDVYDADDASNNPDADVSELTQQQVPAGSIIWDGTGEPSEPVEDGIEVVQVSAINANTIKVVFNQAVEELERADVVVTNVKTSDRQYVKSVTLAEDKKSAEVVFYDNLVTKNTYKVVIGEAEKEFDFVVGDVTKIETNALQVVQADTNTAIKYKVFDANGLDVTADVKDNITFESTLPITEGKVKLDAGTQGFVYVVYKAGTDEEVKSARITVKAEAPKAVKLLAYTVEATPDFTAEDFEAVTAVQKSDDTKAITVYVEDQFGNKSVMTAKFESLNKEVALVDQTSGIITPLKEGTADVRITIGEFSVVRPIEVVANAKVASLNLEKATIEVSDKIAQSVDVVVKDQYGNKFKPATNTVMTATIKSGSNIIALGEAQEEVTFDGEEDKKTFTITPVVGKEGTATIEFAVGEVKTTLTVNVVKAGVIDNYVVEGFKAELDKNVAAKDEEKQMVLKVFGTDANGVKTGTALTENVFYTITDKDKNSVQINAENGVLTVSASTETGLEAGETYKVTVKVGPAAETALTVFEDIFTIKDTTPQPVVEQIGNKIEKKDLTLAIADFDNILEAKLDNETENITEITFKSDNSNVIQSGTLNDEGLDITGLGNATLVVTSVKVDDKDINLNAMVDLVVKLENLEATEATAEKSGEPLENKDRERFYQAYKIKVDNEDLDITGYTVGIQIKPDNTIHYTEPSGDNCIWFPVSDAKYGFEQVEGTHTFYLKCKNNQIYKFTITYEKPEGLPGETTVTP